MLEEEMTTNDELLLQEIKGVPDELDQDNLISLSQASRHTKDYGVQLTKKILNDKKLRRAERFAALYTILVRFRHLKRWDEFAEYVRNYSNISKDQPAWAVLVTEAQFNTATSMNDYKEALKLGQRALKKFNSGGANLLCAEIALEIASNELNPSPENVSKAENYLDAAIEMLELGSDKNPLPPRILATLGRLNALNGDFEIALSMMQKAMSLESPDAENFYIRINEYTNFQGEIRSRKLLSEFSRNTDKAVVDLRSSRLGLMETMALLIAAVTLLITAVQISSNFNALDAAGLISFTGGIIILTFFSFSLGIRTASDIRPAPRMILLIIIALMLLSVGGVILIVPNVSSLMNLVQ